MLNLLYPCQYRLLKQWRFSFGLTTLVYGRTLWRPFLRIAACHVSGVREGGGGREERREG